MTAHLDRLITALTLAYHQLGTYSDALHGPRGVTTGLRSVLLLLHAGGPRTIAGLATDRSVSRQFMQRLVSELSARGLVEARLNPRHRRSALIALTQAGAEEVAAIRALEAPDQASLAEELDAKDLAAALRVLDTLNARLAASLPLRK